MADIKSVPIQTNELFGDGGAFTTGDFREVVPQRGRNSVSFTPYREFKVFGDKQSEVIVRVDGLENSEAIKGLQRVEFAGLHIVEVMAESRGFRRPELRCTARKMIVKKGGI